MKNIVITIIILSFLLLWAYLVSRKWKDNQSFGNCILLLTPLTLFVLIFCMQFLDLKIKAKEFAVERLEDIETDQKLLKATTQHIIHMIDTLNQKPLYWKGYNNQSPSSKKIEETKKELKSLLDGKE